jgi:hypothetical protein
MANTVHAYYAEQGLDMMAMQKTSADRSVTTQKKGRRL